mmetsp:Transcript_73875/g.111287  ORF Transcript_73875/g.111287 Transcript_73875/m.111287 type:complete len:85 (+) Transcript_73875:921-1175(+)
MMIKKSGARIILVLMTVNFDLLLERANEFGLIGDSFVWLISPSAKSSAFVNPLPLARGAIVPSQHFPESTYECFVENWKIADPI